MVQSSQGVHGIFEKEGPEATASLSLPNIHPWTCNLSCWQSACDQNETRFEFFPIRASNSADKSLYFQEPLICRNLITCSAKLSYMRLSVVNTFCSIGVTIVFAV